MKEWIKRNEGLYHKLIALKEWIISCFFFSPKIISKIRYKQVMGRKLNLKNPQEFNEKLMWLKLNRYYKNPLVTQCADKVRVREYVEQCGCKELLIDCLGVYETADEIPWEKLPQQFVLKCNHGAGYNIVCDDKSKLDIETSKKKLSEWLKTDYSLFHAEVQYHDIKPLIICEKYLQPLSGLLPDDYKVYCFNGKAECVMVCQGRETGHGNFYFFDKNWTFLDWVTGESKELAEKIARPVCLEQLWLYAEKLSKGFPFVRVDFYVLDDKVYFGEMTFTPHGCTDPDYTEEGNRELSNMLKLT